MKINNKTKETIDTIVGTAAFFYCIAEMNDALDLVLGYHNIWLKIIFTFIFILISLLLLNIVFWIIEHL